MALKKDMRKFMRAPVRIKVLMSDEESQGFVYFTSRDLSAGGIYLVSDLLLEEGTSVALEFTLPTHKQAVSVKGKIAWAKDEYDAGQAHIPPGMGVEFINLSPANLAIIEKYVTSSMKISRK